MFYVLVVNGIHFHVVLVLQVQYMTDRFQEWRKADDVFKRMRIDGLTVYDKKTGIDWRWQAIDGWCYYKSAAWGKKI
jgi:hypothetical protein